MKIDVKRKIYLVSIEKIDNSRYPRQRLLLPIIVRIDKKIQRYPAQQMRMILVIIRDDCYDRGLCSAAGRRQPAAPTPAAEPPGAGAPGHAGQAGLP
ncbi:MAG: hypothetical protein RSH52_15175 [Janthinobacterium sp.]